MFNPIYIKEVAVISQRAGGKNINGLKERVPLMEGGK
jgi:hypothetical protein